MSPAWPARSKLHMKDRLELAVVQEEAQGISEGGISDSVTPHGDVAGHHSHSLVCHLLLAMICTEAPICGKVQYNCKENGLRQVWGWDQSCTRKARNSVNLISTLL